ncbi:hypothetical protein BP5796_12911 [Coleophoma crateriformis]|uniref:Uncharacterized protein n=1 Tax=Coleophoma crateriformis TaxID=565419 RepID=A0A3D8Q604_9HELO|nr:hypothetical protein BP5796_12911 [Coleophoma crateriformis]
MSLQLAAVAQEIDGLEMSSPNSMSFLPPEVIRHIIDFLVPAPPLLPVALHSSHILTKTYLSLCLTSHATRLAALRLLYTYCLYLDSPHRLHRLDDTLSALSNETIQSGNPGTDSLTYTHFSSQMTSLYLAPFAHDSLDNLPVANSLSRLFDLLAVNLRTLVIDIPLRSLYPDEDSQNVRPIIRRAFSQLTRLQVFCSVRDELYLDLHEPPLNADEPPVWSLWPDIKILALYNVDIGTARFWPHLGRLKSLHTLVLTRCDGLESVDITRAWIENCGDVKRPLTVVLVNIDSDHPVSTRWNGWKDDGAVIVKKVNVPVSYYGDDDPIDLCQELVKRRLLRGEAPDTWT